MPQNGDPVAEAGDEKPKRFEQTLVEELRQIQATRRQRTPSSESTSNTTMHRPENDVPVANDRDIIKSAHRARLFGLSFSGGGIRSATFNLGILQALAKLELLDHVDYLSTVSGGGYIGSWFAAWIRRKDARQLQKQAAVHGQSTTANAGEAVDTAQPDTATPQPAETELHGFRCVVDELRSNGGTDSDPGASQPDPAPIRHLREYSNYLTPRRGLWSADTWTLGVTYLRNFLLTVSVLLGSAFALVLAAGALASAFFELAHSGSVSVSHLAAFGFGITLLVASSFLGWELALKSTSEQDQEQAGNPSPPGKDDNEQEREQRKYRRPPLNWAVFATFLGAVFGSLWLWINRGELTVWLPAAFIVSIAIVSGLTGRWIAARSLPTHIRDFVPPVKHIKHFLRLAVAGTAALGVLVGALYLIGDWMAEWAPPARAIDPSRWHVVIWAPPLVVIAFWFSATSFVGLAGHALRELDRELLARYLAVIIKWSVIITALLLIAVYSYPLLLAAGERGAELNLTLGAAWAAASAVGAWLARSAQNAGGPWVSRLKKIVLMLAPYIFSVGLLLISVWAVHALLNGLLDLDISWLQALRPHELGYVQLDERFWDRMAHGYWRLLLPAGVIVFILTLFWSWRIGVNTFSLHALYGDRLVRAYLGASNINRCAHPFHGFDEADNAVRMQDLVADRYSGPLLIVNTAVNLVSSRRLAWQKRKAASFTFTPLFAGYEFYGDDDTIGDRSGGYIRSAIYGGSNGASLGKAMTISGAAASPNMGYHSSPGLTFLMTTFNVRLGWWLPNTGRHRKRSLAWLWGGWSKRLWQEHISRSDPALGLVYLINELLGRTDAQSDYIYLSDGGHFENLGIYELVRRRCRFIIACDAEADPHMRFVGLGNAIEKCRTDLGIAIHIDVSQLRPDPKTGLSRWHCALGCIGYSEADPGEADGMLLYIKASRTGGEPQDVQTYADQYSAFPHESTADQWFDETQFESYRALGEHSAHRVLSTAVRVARQAWSEDRQKLPGIPERTFQELRKQWYPHAADADSKPADHDALLEAILDTVREDERLAFLDAQLYPDIHRVATSEPSGKCAPAGDKPWLPQNYEQLRAGFYFCKRLIQFMQQVYHDCRLDTEYYAPSNRGWMNLFRRWSWSRMFRFTWVMTAGTYSARFQSFCEHQLDLETGEPRFPERPLPVRAHYAKADNHIEVEALDATTKNVIDWSEAEKTSGINYYEHRLIEEFVRTYARCKPTETRISSLYFDVYALKVDTESPLTDEPDNQAELNAGILIVGPSIRAASGKKAILYFRIRSAMRNMDLARKAFLKFKQQPDLSRYKVEIFEDMSAVEGHLNTPWQKRAFREIHMMKRGSLDRCRWFSQLLEDMEEKDARKPSELPTAAPCTPVPGEL